MIDHFSINVANIRASRIFYTAVLGSLGYVMITNRSTSISFGVEDAGLWCNGADPGGDFWLSQGRPMYPRVHFAFAAASHAQVKSFYALGLTAGGVGNGKPGLRLQYHPCYYAAFLLDPDGYNIEVVCHKEVGED